MSTVVVRHLLAVLMLVIAPCAWAADDVWKLLESGGRVVLMRHTITPPGTGDPPGMRLDDCSTQRNLTDEGRRHAHAIGEAFRSRRIDVGRVLSSPWCRCLETARLAFARAEVSEPLSELFDRPEQSQKQVPAMRAIVAAHRGKANLVLVSHGATIVALADVSLRPGEMAIVTPKSDGTFVVNGWLVVPSQ